jgi:hypothetical protein
LPPQAGAGAIETAAAVIVAATTAIATAAATAAVWGWPGSWCGGWCIYGGLNGCRLHHVRHHAGVVLIVDIDRVRRKAAVHKVVGVQVFDAKRSVQRNLPKA